MPFALLKKKRTSVIDDPMKHASERWGIPVKESRVYRHWRFRVPHCTTAQFEKLDDGFHRHCGPTAMTNLIIAIKRSYNIFPAPNEVFQKVAEIGRKSRAYWNTDYLGHFGGTYDILTGMYIRKCLKEYGIDAEVEGKFDASPAWYSKKLRENCLIYLQLMRNSCYGNHHVICCGYKAIEGREESGRIRRDIYLELIDGWAKTTRWIPATSLKLCHAYAIKPAAKKENSGR
ncbi:MAG: hypothetical protein UHN88_06140 [Eubacterium sp.]|nr:hypothetical protein [Eubacterium sp.]